MKKDIKNKLSWFEVESAIKKEIAWLKNVIFPYQPNKNLLNYSDYVFYRLITILIVSGEIKVFEYDYVNVDKSIFSDLDKKHGSNWHDGMIKYLAEYFLERDFSAMQNEPKLYYGHADLKIEKENKIIYFEIDTINIFKLFINLKVMENVDIILINNSKIIKFEL